MLLRYSLKEEDAAKTIESAVEKLLDEGYRTPDLYSDGFKKVGTDETTEIICRYIG